MNKETLVLGRKIRVLRIINRFNIGGPTYNATFYTQSLSTHFHSFCHPGLVKRDLFRPMESLGTPLEDGKGMKPSLLVELNPNILVRDVERMYTLSGGVDWVNEVFEEVNISMSQSLLARINK